MLLGMQELGRELEFLLLLLNQNTSNFKLFLAKKGLQVLFLRQHQFLIQRELVSTF